MIVHVVTSLVTIGTLALAAPALPDSPQAAPTSAEQWSPRPPMRFARIGPVAAEVTGLIVVTGGFVLPTGELIGATEVRSASHGGRWRRVADVPTARANAAAATFGGLVWVLGGYGERDLPVEVVERYDPRTNTWSRGPTLPQGRAQAGAAVLHDVLYVVGGDIAVGEGEAVTDSGLAFDPRKRKWTPIAPLPVPRDRLRLVAAGKYLYAIGGSAETGTSVSWVDRYDPATNRWTSIADLKQPRTVPGATVVGHGPTARIAVVGGCQFIGQTRTQLRRTTEVFDPATGRWRLHPALLPTGRCSLATVTENDNTVLAIGGFSDQVPTGAATAAVDALRL